MHQKKEEPGRIDSRDTISSCYQVQKHFDFDFILPKGYIELIRKHSKMLLIGK